MVNDMSVKRRKGRTGRPVAVQGEKATGEKIFDAAVDLFAERGYDGVSVRDIAKAVGISEGAVYRHYASKEEILEAVFAFIENRIYAPPQGGSLEGLVEALSFREFLESIPRYMVADRALAKITRIMLIEMYHNEKIRSYVQKELYERPIEETEAIFRLFLERGKIRRCDPRALATLYISYLVGWYLQTFVLSYTSSQDIDRMLDTARGQIGLIVEAFSPEGLLV